MDFQQKIILFIVNIYTYFYGDVYAGHFKSGVFILPNFFENYLCLFPSYFNHLYAKLFYKEYLYTCNNLILHSLYKPTLTIIPPLIEFKINNMSFKNNIIKFYNNVPLKYIFIYYGLWTTIDDNVSYKYIKNGFKLFSTKIRDIEDKSLYELLI